MVELKQFTPSVSNSGKLIIIMLEMRILGNPMHIIGVPQESLRIWSSKQGHHTAAQAPPPAAFGGAPQASGYGAPMPAYTHGGPQAPMQHINPNSYGQQQQQQQQQIHNAPLPSNPYGVPPSAAAIRGPPPANPYGPPPTAAGGGYRSINGGPTARDDAPAAITPISHLNSYQNRWTIKARVVQKTDVRRYNSAKGDGRFFSFDIIDNGGGEIRVVCWNDTVERFYDQIQVGSVYLISKASLRNKRGNYNQTRHQFEIHLENGSLVELCQDGGDIPKILLQFTSISALEDVPAGATVDVLGVVDSIMDWSTITKKDGTETQKRSLTIRDDSGRSIELTLWGNYVHEPGTQLQQEVSQGRHPVVAVKSARVGDFNGKTVSTISSSTIMVDPVDVPEAAKLRAWYDRGGAQVAPQALSMSRGAGGSRSDRLITVSQIDEEGLGTGNSTAWVTCMGTVSFLKADGGKMYYPACTLSFNGKQCNKKLVEHDGGTWYCNRCDGQCEPEWRYILHLQINDHTGEYWASAFNEVGPELLGMAAADIRRLAEGDMEDLNEFHAVTTRAANKPYLFKLKITEEVYNEEPKRRVTVVKADPLDSPELLVSQSKQLITMIHAFQRGESPLAPPTAVPAQHQQQLYGGAMQQQMHHPPQFGAPAPGGWGSGGMGGYGGQAFAGGYGQPVAAHARHWA